MPSWDELACDSGGASPNPGVAGLGHRWRQHGGLRFGEVSGLFGSVHTFGLDLQNTNCPVTSVIQEGGCFVTTLTPRCDASAFWATGGVAGHQIGGAWQGSVN